jgi:hypothetical protein
MSSHQASILIFPQEYSANLIIPFPIIINAVEIDPVSKSKPYCMQIISDERNYRFCALSDDDLAKWLGAFKSLFAKRKEAQSQRISQAPGSNPAVGPPVPHKHQLASA